MIATILPVGMPSFAFTPAFIASSSSGGTSPVRNNKSQGKKEAVVKQQVELLSSWLCLTYLGPLRHLAAPRRWVQTTPPQAASPRPQCHHQWRDSGLHDPAPAPTNKHTSCEQSCVQSLLKEGS